MRGVKIEAKYNDKLVVELDHEHVEIAEKKVRRRGSMLKLRLAETVGSMIRRHEKLHRMYDRTDREAVEVAALHGVEILHADGGVDDAEGGDA